MVAVVIGVDPHKRSNTALVLDPNENVLARQWFANDRDGYRELKRFARSWRDRTWAVEGARGVGLGLAQRLAAEGETVLNVPGKTPLEAMRCLKRRLSDVVFRALLDDLANKHAKAGPGGHSGATLQSSASGPTPAASPSDKSLPGPARPDATPAPTALLAPA